MKKMKRLDLIVKGQELVSELFGIKTRKIKRAIESAIDTAEERAFSAEERVTILLAKLGENYDNPQALTDTINSLCVTMDEAQEWRKKAEQVKRVKSLLEEEVEVKEE